MKTKIEKSCKNLVGNQSCEKGLCALAAALSLIETSKKVQAELEMGPFPKW